MKRERRFNNGELRVTTATDQAPVLRGYAAVFNSDSEDMGGWREQLAPGAFANAIKDGNDVRCLVNHDANLVLGRSKSGTLRMIEDEKGLAFECTLPDTQYARDLAVSVERGDISGCSFGMFCKKDSWEKRDGVPTRIVHDVELFDVSAVTYPAYSATDVQMRSLMFPDGVVEYREKTKSVDGEEHPASDFAYVGDPEDISTWHLPIFDAAHVRNALARFGQTEGIPETEKPKVHAKIMEAAKKFGIDEQKSAAMSNAECTCSCESCVTDQDCTKCGCEDCQCGGCACKSASEGLYSRRQKLEMRIALAKHQK